MLNTSDAETILKNDVNQQARTLFQTVMPFTFAWKTGREVGPQRDWLAAFNAVEANLLKKIEEPAKSLFRSLVRGGVPEPLPDGDAMRKLLKNLRDNANCNYSRESSERSHRLHMDLCRYMQYATSSSEHGLQLLEKIFEASNTYKIALPLYWTVIGGQQGLESTTKTHRRKSRYECNPLHYAVVLNDLPLVRELIADYSELLNAFNKQGYTPAALAATLGYPHMLNALIEAGADIEKGAGFRCEGGALAAAIKTDQLATAQILIEKKSVIGQGSFSLAFRLSRTDMLKLLLSAPFDPEQPYALYLPVACNTPEFESRLNLILQAGFFISSLPDHLKDRADYNTYHLARHLDAVEQDMPLGFKPNGGHMILNAHYNPDTSWSEIEQQAQRYQQYPHGRDCFQRWLHGLENAAALSRAYSEIDVFCSELLIEERYKHHKTILQIRELKEQLAALSEPASSVAAKPASSSPVAILNNRVGIFGGTEHPGRDPDVQCRTPSPLDV